MIYEGFEFGSQEALIGGFYAGRAHGTKNTKITVISWFVL